MKRQVIFFILARRVLKTMRSIGILVAVDVSPRKEVASKRSGGSYDILHTINF